MNQEQLEQFVGFFKALAEVSRLRIVGLLAEKDRTGEELAAALRLHPGTISHHMARLTASGIVSARPQGYYTVYRLNPDSLHALAERLLSNKGLARVASDLDPGAYERKVLKDFVSAAGTLRTIPAQRKKRSVILRHIVQELTPARHYSEKQLNNILKRFHADTATMRREMIAEKLIVRQNGEYWRIET
jgi:DNA-binding transcriptional ArsR family regulator